MKTFPLLLILLTFCSFDVLGQQRKNLDHSSISGIGREKVSSQYFSDSDFEYLEKLKTVISENQDETNVRNLLREYDSNTKNGILFRIELDIKGYFELENQNKNIRIVKEKFLNKSRLELFDLLMARINSVQKGEFYLPEPIYGPDYTQISFNDQSIQVRELQRKSWDYILYETEDRNEHYVELVYQKYGGVYTQIHKINLSDSKSIKKAAKYADVERVIQKYK